jgi:hypothetical protein
MPGDPKVYQVASDLGVYECGDYRIQHKDGTGVCALNWAHGGEEPCFKFRLSRAESRLTGEAG